MRRICFVSLSAYGYFNESAPAGGGAQRQLYFLATNLTDSFDVHFVVGDYRQPKTEIREDVTLHRAYTPDRSASPLQRIGQLGRLVNALRRADADVYVVRCPPQKLNILYVLTRLLRRPLVYHVATDAFVSSTPEGVSGIQQKLYYKALQTCPVITQKPYQADQLQTFWDTSATVIPNGYPPASVIDTFESREHFLWVGRLDKTEKRPHLFLDLADELPDHQFIMIGPPERDDSYSEHVIERASSSSNVTYSGRVSPSNIHKYYQRAIAVINTSAPQREGFPNTFLESWRYGTPILSLDIDPGRFLDTEQETTGYAGGDFDTLASLADNFANSLTRRRALGIAGLNTFEQRYQLETIVDSYQTILEETITGE